MKKITVEFSETGKDGFVAQANVKIRVDGKFVKNDRESIIVEAIEKNGSCKYRIIKAYHNVSVEVTMKSGNYKIFSIDVLELNVSVGADVFMNNIEKITSFIKEIEEFVYDVHSTTNNYFREYK